MNLSSNLVKNKLLPLIELHNNEKEADYCNRIYDLIVDYLNEDRRYTTLVPSSLESDYSFHLIDQNDGELLGYLALFCRTPFEEYRKLYELSSPQPDFGVLTKAMESAVIREIPPLKTNDGLEYIVDVVSITENLLQFGVLIPRAKHRVAYSA